MSRPDIDPEIQAFAAQLSEDWKNHPPLETLSLPQAREVAEVVRRRWRSGGPEMAATEEGEWATDSGPMRYRIHVPVDTNLAAVMIYLHGGGFTLFSIDTHDRLMREYADAGGIAVVGLDYALSPEHKYPAALEQVLVFIRAMPELGRFAGKRLRLALGGDSAGANLALATALRLRDGGDSDRIAGLLLNYGAFSPAVSDAAERRLGGPGAVLNRAELDYFWSNYLSNESGALDPYANVLSANLAGLPPALLIVPDCDVLAEQSLALAESFGPGADLRVYPGATHSFLEAMSVSGLARLAIAESATWLKRTLLG